MASDTIRDIFTKQNQVACNTILNDLDNWICDKFSDANDTTVFRAQQGDKVYTSTIEHFKTQYQVKCNAYAKRIANSFCSINSN
jgi:hypothetical protein